MICITCGSTEFTVHDGIFYCTECSTQIEETRDEVIEEVSFHRRTLVSSPSVERTTKEKGRTEYSEWITAEAYNIIIYQQVCALIDLGASTNLKDTVLHIWSKYLQKCEVAFRKDYKAVNGDNLPRLGPAPSKRDVKVLYGDKVIRPSRKKKQKSKNSIKKETVTEEETDGATSEAASDSDSSVSSVIKKHKLGYSSFARKLVKTGKLKKKNKVIHVNDVHNMTLKKTLSFCYLGLLYTEDRLSLSDLIRLAYEDKIPYLNIIDRLSPMLQLQDSDYKTFLTYSVPDSDEIHRTACEIVKFLHLPKYKEPSFFFALSRLLKVFNLPDDLKTMVTTLFEKYKERVARFHTKLEEIPIDYITTAFILVVIKMLFIIDGRFEMEHSEVIIKLNSIKPDSKYFVWSEWKEQAVLKEFLFMTENPGICNMNKFDSLSADRIITKYPYTQLRPPTSEDLLRCRNKIVSKGEIKNILADIVTIPQSKESIPSSFPVRSMINYIETEWRTLHMYKETKEIDFTLLKKDFSSHSLLYNPLQYDKTDELSYFMMASLYPPDMDVEPYFNFLNKNSSKCNYITTSTGYWFVKTVNKDRCAKTETLSDWMNEVPAAFKWLINYVCKCTYLSSFNLYYYMVEIEKLLFLGKKTVKSLESIKNKMLIQS